MGSIDPRSLRDAVNAIRGQRPGEKKEKGKESGKNEKPPKRDDGIVSRRDEKGMPYGGDFPNPASDRNRGCF